MSEIVPNTFWQSLSPKEATFEGQRGDPSVQRKVFLPCRPSNNENVGDLLKRILAEFELDGSEPPSRGRRPLYLLQWQPDGRNLAAHDRGGPAGVADVAHNLLHEQGPRQRDGGDGGRDHVGLHVELHRGLPEVPRAEVETPPEGGRQDPDPALDLPGATYSSTVPSI